MYNCRSFVVVDGVIYSLSRFLLRPSSVVMFTFGIAACIVYVGIYNFLIFIFFPFFLLLVRSNFFFCFHFTLLHATTICLLQLTLDCCCFIHFIAFNLMKLKKCTFCNCSFLRLFKSRFGWKQFEIEKKLDLTHDVKWATSSGLFWLINSFDSMWCVRKGEKIANEICFLSQFLHHFYLRSRLNCGIALWWRLLTTTIDDNSRIRSCMHEKRANSKDWAIEHSNASDHCVLWNKYWFI